MLMAARYDIVALTSSVLFAAAVMRKVDHHAHTLLILMMLCVACIHDITILATTINLVRCGVCLESKRWSPTRLHLYHPMHHLFSFPLYWWVHFWVACYLHIGLRLLTRASFNTLVADARPLCTSHSR